MIPQVFHEKNILGFPSLGDPPKIPHTSKNWSFADRSHQLPVMALWMYGFLVVSAELSGQNATVHGRNLEEYVNCGVCKAVPLSTCDWCDGTGGKAQISTKKPELPPNSQQQGPKEDIFAIGVGVLMLLSCGAFLAWCLWKRHQEKKNVDGANPDLELQPAPGPGQIFPPRQPSPVQCSGQISAQWPRRKVAFFNVESGAFEAFGHRYSIEHPDEPQLTKFHWADGTLQTLVRSHRNTIEWQTNHSNPEWQRFLWVCAFPN